ncbi:MAG: hypothetical protein ACR2OH_12505 [Microthrixaceae bacterium]
MRNLLKVIVSSLALVTFLTASACGDDDGDSSAGSDSSTTEATDTDADQSDSGSDGTDGADDTADADDTGDAAFPNEEFCAAVDDFKSAQDGAQRNQALGDMAEAAGADLPPALSQALENLDTGDLPAEAYSAAEDALSSVCD